MRSAFNLMLAALCLTLVVTAGWRREDARVSTPTAARSESSDDYESAVSLARQEGSEVLLVFGARWCVWCQKFARDVMPNQRIASRLSEKRATVVRVDVDNRNDLAERYGVKSLPTMVLLDHQGREVKRMSGFATVREFLGWID